MADYTDLQQKFHLISGTYIAGKIFSEYACLLKSEFDHTKKGETTRYNRVVEAEAKVVKVVDLLGENLKSIGCDLGITEKEVENLENILYAILTLDETSQKRVMGLIEKIKK